MPYNEKRIRFDALPSPEVNSAEISAIRCDTGFVQQVIKWLETKNALGTHKNDETGWNDIAVNRRTVKSVIHHGGGDGKIALLGIIPKIINSGIYLETNHENKERLVSHIFASKATIDGEPYAITYIIREDRESRRYYDHNLTKIKTLDHLNGQAPKSADIKVHKVIVINPFRELSADDKDSQGIRLDQCLRPMKIPSIKLPLNNILKKHLAVNT
jgi:hypothetical protein